MLLVSSRGAQYEYLGNDGIFRTEYEIIELGILSCHPISRLTNQAHQRASCTPGFQMNDLRPNLLRRLLAVVLTSVCQQ